jgi:hypothetical protein
MLFMMQQILPIIEKDTMLDTCPFVTMGYMLSTSEMITTPLHLRRNLREKHHLLPWVALRTQEFRVTLLG